MNQIIQFIYGGKLDTKLCNIRDAKQVCTFIPINQVLFHMQFYKMRFKDIHISKPTTIQIYEALFC